MKNYTREQFWELYKNLPKELKDALFSEDIGNTTYNICVENNIEDKLDDIVNCVGQVLTGFLMRDELIKNLEEIIREKGLAEKIYLELNQLIFSPVMDKINLKEVATAIETPTESYKTVEENLKKDDQDTYRELIE